MAVIAELFVSTTTGPSFGFEKNTVLVVDQNDWGSLAMKDFVTVEFYVGHGISPPLAIPSQPYRVVVGEASDVLWCPKLPESPS